MVLSINTALNQTLQTVRGCCLERYDAEMQRRLEPLLPRYRGSIAFAKANSEVEAFWPLLRKWRVLSLPALVLLAFGRHVGTQIGLRSEQQLTKLFDGLAAVQRHSIVEDLCDFKLVDDEA